MELRVNLQNLFGLHVHSSVLIGWDLATSPPAFGLIYEGAIGQPRQTISLWDPLDLLFGTGTGQFILCYRETRGRTRQQYRGVIMRYNYKDPPAWQSSFPVRGSRFLKDPGESRGSHLRPCTQLKGPRVQAAVDILLHTGRDIKGLHLENFLIVCSTRNSIYSYPYLHANSGFMDHLLLLNVNLH